MLIIYLSFCIKYQTYDDLLLQQNIIYKFRVLWRLEIQNQTRPKKMVHEVNFPPHLIGSVFQYSFIIIYKILSIVIYHHLITNRANKQSGETYTNTIMVLFLFYSDCLSLCDISCFHHHQYCFFIVLYFSVLLSLRFLLI